jgi:hypothetical protein
MNSGIIAYIAEEGGKLVSQLIRLRIMTPRPKTREEEPPVPQPAAIAVKPVSETQRPSISLPTREETARELRRRLAKELYKAELDLAGGLKIAGKSCDCLSNKHTLLLEAAAEELISQDPSNPVYLEIIQWVKDNGHKVTVEAIQSGKYKEEYRVMASQFKDLRKRVMGTAAPSDMKEPPQAITLEEAKELAAEEATKEVEKRWDSQEKK